MNQKKLIIALLFLLLGKCLVSQELSLRIITNDSIVESKNVIQSKRSDVQKILGLRIQELIQDNYLEASIDSIWFDSLDNSYYAELHQGPKYDLSQISIDSLSEEILDDIPFNSINNSQEYIFIQKYASKRYADNGYPFAKIELISTRAGDSLISGYLKMNKGPLITIDSIQLQGNIKLSNKFIYKYLGIKPGSAYDHTQVSKISGRLDQLSFLDQYQEADLTFYGNYSTINLYLQANNTSRFDFIFGIIPSTQIQNRSLFLSFDITAELLNKLGTGEYFYFDYERLRPEQQKFDIKFNYPYIFDLNYAFDLKFSIFRNSLDYQTLISDIGIQYLFNSQNKLKLSWLYESSKLVEIDSTSLYQTASLPQDLDIAQNGLSLELQLQDLDYPFNPQRGYSANFRASGGIKEIQRNSSILNLKNESTDFSTAYDSLDLKSSRFELSSQFNYYIPLARRTCIASEINMGWRYSKNGLYRNEKFQIGGNKLLRGFDEAQFFTSYYALMGLEYKILLNNNSYLSAPFIDFAFIENNLNENIWALGLGAGLGIQTKAGQLQFSVAVGRTKETDYDFGRPKAHVGYVSLF